MMMTPSDQPSPKPCPFCGCSNYRLVSETGWMDCCLSCGAGSPRWNSRPIEEALEARVAELQREPYCESCGANLSDPDANNCHGCDKAICFLCVEAFGHVTDGAHGVGDPSDWWNDRLGECESLRSRVAELELDRERLDWLEQAIKSIDTDLVVTCWANEDIGQESEILLDSDGRTLGKNVLIRAAIDAARTVTEREGK